MAEEKQWDSLPNLDAPVDELSQAEAEAPKQAEPTQEKEWVYTPFLAGDTFESFATRHGRTVEELIEKNKCNPAILQKGYWLWA